MGLDMYLHGEKYLWNLDDRIIAPQEDGFPVTRKILDLGYWRKHPNLHGYIVQTFADGVDECQKIELSSESLALIIAAIQENKLPPTTGFFFGESDGTEAPDDIAIFRKAREWLDAETDGESRTVYYQASW